MSSDPTIAQTKSGSSPTDSPLVARDNAIRMVNVSIVCGVLYLLVAFPLFTLGFPNKFLFWEHVGLGIGVVVILALVNIGKRPEIGRLGMLYLAAIQTVVLGITGGAYGAGVYVMLPVYIFIYFLGGAKLGSRLIMIVFAIFSSAYALYLLGILNMPYTKQNFGFFLFCYLLAYVFFILYARQKDKLDAQLKESLRQNEDLVDQLKREKTSVERKIRDRTRELSEAQAELVASIRSLPFGFALINAKDQITFANAQLGQLLGHPMPQYGAPSELTIDDVITELGPKVKLSSLLDQAQAKRHPIERNIIHDSLFLRLFIAPIIGTKDDIIGAVLIIENTTEQKALDRSRDEFFSIASHELRTPLTAIRGNIGMILNYYQDLLKDPNLHQMLTDSHDASVRLIEIVNDFLDASRLEQGRLVFKIEVVDILSLIQEVIREYDNTITEHKLKLTLSLTTRTLPLVMADRDRVRQIFVNLLSNAIKYTPNGGHITIRPVVKARTLQIQVQDTGQGIPIESQHLLFRKFQQAANNILTRDNTRSTGLGLYIAKLIAQGMHGRLFLEHSELGKGSTFTLELPLAPHLEHTSKLETDSDSPKT